MNWKQTVESRPIALFLLLFITVVAFLFNGTPGPQSIDADPAKFSAARASLHLKEITKETHPTASEGAKRVQAYLLAQLQDLGLETQTQEGVEGEHAFVNVLGRLKGKSSKQTIGLVAHYDSVPGSFGAGDDGAGVASILETLRAVKTTGLLENDLVVCFTDAEEIGLYGAKHFVATHPWAQELDFVTNLEGRGTRGAVIMFETTPNNRWLMNEYLQSTDSPVAYSISYEIYKRMPNGTDFTELMKIPGVQGLNFAFLGQPRYYHSPNDTLANLSQKTLQHMGDQVLSVTRHFGDSDIKAGEPVSDVYFYVPVLGVVGYPIGLTLPLLGLLIILVLAYAIVGLKAKKLTVGGMFGGLFASALILVLAIIGTVIGFELSRILGRPDMDRLVGHPLDSEYYFFGLAALCFAIVLGLSRAIWRKHRIENLAFGSLVIWVLLAGLLSTSMPGGGYLFTLPALLITLASLVVVRCAPEQRGYKALVLTGFAAFPVLMFLPFVGVFFLALPFPVPAILTGLLIGLFSLLLTQLWDSLLPEDSRKWLTRSAFLLGLLMMVVLTVKNAGPGQQPAENHSHTAQPTAPAQVEPKPSPAQPEAQPASSPAEAQPAYSQPEAQPAPSPAEARPQP